MKLFQWLIPFIFIVDQITADSINRPQLCLNATWNSSGTTLLTNVSLSEWPNVLSINPNNTILTIKSKTGEIIILSNNITMIIPTNLTDILDLVTNDNEEIIVASFQSNRITRWSLNNGTFLSSELSSSRCQRIFLDVNNSFYCSLSNNHTIIKQLFTNLSSSPTTIAGTDCAGFSPSMLNSPFGIFVTLNKSLYVADSGNNRIQLFFSNRTDGITVAGNGASGSILLNYPMDIILDRNDHLFIADTHNSRIIGSDSSGFRCIVGCYGLIGSAPDRLIYPAALSFDNQGNLHVLDSGNQRLQKFHLIRGNGCNESTSANSISANFNPSTTIQTPTMNETHALSINQVKLCSNVSWQSNGTTFATNTVLGLLPWALFIDRNDTIIVINRDTGYIFGWQNGNSTVVMNISAQLHFSYSVFMRNVDEIFVTNNWPFRRVERWNRNNSTLISWTPLIGTCRSIFISVNDDLFCSLSEIHQVVKQSWKNPLDAPLSVAGTGCAGSDSRMLNSPEGIFVTEKLDLYVADSMNNRIQLFSSGNINGTTLVLHGSSGNISLSYPTGIILDANGYLFIVDSKNNRIIGSDAHGYRCVAGSSTVPGLAMDQLNNPSTISFDKHGNLFVMDMGNNRLQKFPLAFNDCQSTTTSVTSSNKMTSLSYFQDSTYQTRTRTTDISTTSILLISPSSFSPTFCTNLSRIGSFCNISNTPCDILQPCLNHGVCFNNKQTSRGYNCSCPVNFTGNECQIDRRVCPPKGCLNDGICSKISDDTYICQCLSDWEGDHCQRRKNYCHNITCENQGVCRSFVSNYRCECLGESYSGVHCEVKAKKTIILERFATSMAFICIVFMISVAIIIILMDIMKYVLNIDIDLRKPKHKKRKVNTNRRIIHFIYFNGLPMNQKETNT